MRHWVAAILALWFAAMSAAPLAAAAFQNDGPKMACCKRQAKNCCCRKAHSSAPLISAVPSCGDSCAASPSSSPVAVGLARVTYAFAYAADVVVRVQPKQLLSVSRHQEFDLYQRPPPTAV
jgi:hypothetical protein